jgi:16S rRNA (guanine527-N7)-methyltransferase
VGSAGRDDVGGLRMTAEEIGGLLDPYVGFAGAAAPAMHTDWPRVYAQLAVYLELILKWNAKTNLTAIREPEAIVRRHFGESLFVGGHLGECGTLLDFGSGAGFPGVPIQLMRPDVRVTLAESQGKKAAFLREVVRVLGLDTEVWAGRVEAMPAGRRFDAVAMRAVDNMGAAVGEAVGRAGKRLLILGTSEPGVYPEMVKEFHRHETVDLPGLTDGVLLIARR